MERGSLLIGTRLDHFEITAKLGEGGMGEVFRARDTRLDREVAIKVLPAALTEDPERLARFEREAKLLASLNHPNIAAIYEVGEAEGLHYIAMELAAGEDLAQRLARGPLPVDDAIEVALQIAHALEAAHESGVVHRDLKPANVMVGADNRVKVLDFGLARAGAEAGSQTDLSVSPTLTAQMTQAGVILGTAAYMSPEQAKGKLVDKRADIWSFGVILWEMLAGKRLFGGESTSEVLAAVLMSQPDPDALPARTPPRVRRLLERCLRQDPGSRLRDIGDARIVLEEALAAHEWTLEPQSGPRQRRRAPLTAALLVVGGVALGALAAALLTRPWAPPDRTVTRLAVPLPPTLRVERAQISADGRTLVIRALDVDPAATDRRPRLFVRHLDTDDLVEIGGSAGVRAHTLSPDGAWAAFVVPASASLRRLEVLKVPLDLSSPALKVADWPEGATEVVWPSADTLVAARPDALIAIPAGGGEAGASVPLAGAVEFVASSATPDGRHVLGSWANFDSGAYRQDVVAVDWRTGEMDALVRHGSWPELLPSGHLVFGRQDKLLAVPIDIGTLGVRGSPAPIMDRLWAEGLWSGTDVDVSSTGHLLYKLGGVQGDHRWLAFVEPDGSSTPWSDERLHFNFVWASPDGKWLAAQIDNISQGDALLQIRISPIDRPRLTNIGALPGRDCQSAAWSPDSKHLAFSCANNESSNLYAAPIDLSAAPRLLLEAPAPVDMGPIGFSSDLDYVLVERQSSDGSYDLLAVPTRSESPGPPVTIEMSEARVAEPALSRDGRWLGYISDEAGRSALFVRRLLGPTTVSSRIQIAQEAHSFEWAERADGGLRLVFARGDRFGSRIFAVDLTTEWPPRVSDPVPLEIDPFALGIRARALSALPDGRFLAVRTPDTERGATDLRLALDWTGELEERFRP